MAKRKVNKAAKIRETFDALGAGARPKDVIQTLAGKKIKVTSAQVSNIKSRMNGHAPQGRKPAAKSRKSGMIAISDLQAAKRLVESLGSLERAKTALTALAQLQ